MFCGEAQENAGLQGSHKVPFWELLLVEQTSDSMQIAGVAVGGVVNGHIWVLTVSC